MECFFDGMILFFMMIFVVGEDILGEIGFFFVFWFGIVLFCFGFCKIYVDYWGLVGMFVFGIVFV